MSDRSNRLVVQVTLFVLMFCAFITSAAHAKPMKHQVTGLFAAEREQDLREVFAKLEHVKLVSIDFKNAEIILEYEPAMAFPKSNPEQIIQKLNSLIKGASNSTFGIKPLRSIPREKLHLIVIPAAGLDCKACCLAAYESIYKLEGVEQATASFREGRITAWIQPEKTNRSKLEDALKKRGVALGTP